MTAIAITLIVVGAFFVGQSIARTPKPIPIPAALAKARAACPNDRPACLRAKLAHAYQAVSWQRSENLKLARKLVGNVAAWTCIHNGTPVEGGKPGTRGQGEGSWKDRGDPYWGGLQMNRGFMLAYGRDMIARHHGGLADTWTPAEQIVVGQRAYAQGRGYHPWPTTGRACGLIS